MDQNGDRIMANKGPLKASSAPFRSNDEVEKYLKDPAIAAALGSPGAKVESFKQLHVKAGGSQSKLYSITLSDGKTFFVKQLREKGQLKEQKIADAEIREKLGPYAEKSPFVMMLKGEEFGERNAIAIFPMIKARTLISTYEKDSEDEQIKNYTKLGAVISKVHVEGMKNKGELERFYSSGSNLNGFNIVMHDDFQASNIMITDSGEIHLVDTGCTDVRMSNPYDNIAEVWEMRVKPSPKLMKAFLEGYLSNFEPAKQNEVLGHIHAYLLQKNEKRHQSEKISAEMFASMIPSTPVSVDLAANKENQKPNVQSGKEAKPQEEETKREAKRQEELAKREAKRKEEEVKRLEKEEAKRKVKEEKERKKQIEAALKTTTISMKVAKKEAEELVKSEKMQEKLVKSQTKEVEKQSAKQLKEFSKAFPEFTTFSKMKIPDKQKNKEKMENKAGKLLYKLNNGKIFWKAIKGNVGSPGVEQGREVAGAWVANHITNGLVPRSHVRKVDGKLGIAQEFVTITNFTPDSIKGLNKKQVTQILTHLIADKAISNYDAHLDNYGLDEHGQVIGIDKGEAFRFFQRGKVGFKTDLHHAGSDSDEINLDQYGPANINFYKQVFDLVQKGELEVDFDDPMIRTAIAKCTELTLDDVKKMYSGYAELNFKQKPKQEEFYQEVYQRLQNMPKMLNAFKAKVLKVPVSKPVPIDVIPFTVAAAQKATEVDIQAPKKATSVDKIAPKKASQVFVPKSKVDEEPPTRKNEQALDELRVKPIMQKKPDVGRQAPEQKPETQPVEPIVEKGKENIIFADLPQANKANVSEMLSQFGDNLADITKKLKEKYQAEKLKIKGKGFFHKFHSPHKTIIVKRDQQVNELSLIFDKLQKDPALNAHEKAILLYGALQVTIDNIARTEANSPYKSGLSQMCHKLQADLKGDTIGITPPDSSQAKILYHIYKSAKQKPADKFREAAEAGLANRLKMAQK